MLTSPPLLPTVSLCALLAGLGWAVTTTPTQEDLNAYFSPESFTKAPLCPPGVFAGPPVDDFRAEWYAKIWRAADERSLYRQAREAGPSSRRTFRFTLIPSFAAPIVVRLDERPDGRLAMTAKRLSGLGGYGPGVVSAKIERVLTPDETRVLLRTLDDTRIRTAQSGECDAGLDGTQWVFEGVEAGKLHYVDRWSPERGPVRKVGLAFLALTGWPPERRAGL
jgi:hypothetical protein